MDPIFVYIFDTRKHAENFEPACKCTNMWKFVKNP